MKKIIIFGSLLVFFLLVGLSGCVQRGENILKNSGFECGSDDGPSHWFQAIIPQDNLTMTWDSTVVYNGNYSLGINNSYIYENVTCNNWAQQIEEVPKNRFFELSGWVKTIEAEAVVMVVQCLDEEGDFVGFGTTGDINGTNDWTEYSSMVYVPPNTNQIIVRLALCGTGQVWFDDVELTAKI
ncbi:MAG: hypothetical protein QCH96_00230 [Candidatus Thermoplasmatota archaeon]|nr:hypothetical protein [Candidatus Thermoplasmatota archaeon]